MGKNGTLMEEIISKRKFDHITAVRYEKKKQTKNKQRKVTYFPIFKKA